MNAEILAVGSELTSGHTVNSNASYLARRLQEHGIACLRHVSVADDPGLIVASIREALPRCQLLVITGGLGPTLDDLTMEAIARAVGRPLVYASRVARDIGAFYLAHRRRASRVALRQAYLPSGGLALPNPAGSAPGLWLEADERIVVALPGVPHEMRAILEQSVLPRLRARARGAAIVSRTIRTIGLVELQIQAVLKRLRLPDAAQVGFYPHLRAVDVRFTVAQPSRANAIRLLDGLERRLRQALGEAVYGIDEQTLEDVIGRLLVRRHWTLALAESCTGGLIGDRLTNVPGSSRYLLMSVVAYHNQIKQEWLGVRPELLARCGAVSASVAKAMAEGARERAGADVGLAVTGIAGPSGGTPTKPVGLVYLGLADARGSRARRYRFHGERLVVKYQASQMALDWLRRRLLATDG